jgi:hypothetical protein
MRLITIFIFLIGLGFFFYSFTLPYWKDEELAYNLLTNSDCIDEKEAEELAELRTNKTTFMDLGAGIAIASGIIFVFLLLTKSKKLSDLRNVSTFNKSAIFISANLTWLLLLPGTFWFYWFRGARGDYPPFADSVGIAIVAQIPLLLLLLLPLNIFLILTTIKTNLPTRLFIKANNYNTQKILWEVFFGFWLLLNLILLIAFVIDGDHFAIPTNLFFTFILLSLRAGQISKNSNTKLDFQTNSVHKDKILK